MIILFSRKDKNAGARTDHDFRCRFSCPSALCTHSITSLCEYSFISFYSSPLRWTIITCCRLCISNATYRNRTGPSVRSCCRRSTYAQGTIDGKGVAATIQVETTTHVVEKRPSGGVLSFFGARPSAQSSLSGGLGHEEESDSETDNFSAIGHLVGPPTYDESAIYEAVTSVACPINAQSSFKCTCAVTGTRVEEC